MVKKNTKNPQNNKSPLRLGAAWRKLLALPKIVLAIVAFVVVILGYNLVYIPVLKAVERRQYDAAAQEMRELMDKVVTEIGEPEKTETKKACNYTSVKYSKGDLYCFTEAALTYVVADISYANNVILKSSNVVSDFYDIDSNPVLLKDDDTTTYKNSTIDLKTRNELSCSIFFEFSGRLEVSTIKATYNCTGHPKTEIYPLEK